VTALDRFLPVFQFHERHEREIAASQETVFAAVKAVTAGEIRFLTTLAFIRRLGRAEPRGMLAPPPHEPILKVATETSFVLLEETSGIEIVFGTAVIRPPGVRRHRTPDEFRALQGPGMALAAMNFLIVPGARGGVILSTETRIFASDPKARRSFRNYWLLIYPGSAFIRRMWLRAIERRALKSDPGRQD
jgi:hypothetical protein